MANAKTVIALNVGMALEKGTEYEAAPGGYLVSLSYKQMEDKATGKKKAAPKPFIACLPVLELPSCQNAALDSILRSTMEGYAESLLRKLRTEEKEADGIEFVGATAEQFAPDGSVAVEAYCGDFGLDSIIAHAEEKASSLKFSEAMLSAWWTADGEAACKASYMAATGKAENDPATVKAVATIATLFLKLSAPTPDLELPVCKVMLQRINVIEEATSTTQAIRRRLQKRITDLEQAQTLLTAEAI